MPVGMTAQTRFRVWQAVVIAWVGLWAGFLIGMWGDGGGTRTVWLVGGWCVLGGLGLVVVALLRTTPKDAIVLPRQRSERVILSVCVGLMGVALVGLPSRLSTDHHRYLLEGRMWLDGVSPYRVSPAQWVGLEQAERLGVNHPELRSIYPPTAQAVFAASAAAGRVGGGSDSLGKGEADRGLWGLRVMAGLAALGGGVLLLAMLRDAGKSAWWAAPVLWSPVWILETVATPHVDVFGVVLMLAALRLGMAPSAGALPLGAANGVQRGWIAGVLLALACGVKPQVVVVLPFLVRDGGLRPLLGFAFASVPLAGVISWQGGWAGFFETTRLYTTSWEANGSVFELLKSLAGLGEDPHTIERLKDVGRLSGPVALVLAGWLMWHGRVGVVAAAFGLQGVLLLTSPVVYPWYLLWVLPLAVLVPAGGTAALVASATVGLSYLLGRLGQGWTLPAWALWAEWGPVYAALGWTLVRHLRSSPAGRETENQPTALTPGGGDNIRP